MNVVAVLGVCELMIIWIMATYKLFGICLLRVASGGAGTGFVVRLVFAVNTP